MSDRLLAALLLVLALVAYAIAGTSDYDEARRYQKVWQEQHTSQID